MRLVPAFFTAAAILVLPGVLPIAFGEDIRPGRAIEYKPMYPELWQAKGQVTQMIPWEGKHVVFLTTTADLDRTVMTRVVERLDGGWKLYADCVGKAPREHMLHNKKPTIAAVPDSSFTCGVGCGHIGFTGIEVGGFYAEWDYPYIKQHPDAFPHYFFYEMGRNYYLFENRHSAFTTGFSVFMRYVCMDALKCEDREADTRTKIEAVEAELAKARMPFLKAFTTVTGTGGDEYVDLIPGYPSAQKEIYASAMLKLRRDHGGDEWVKRFFRFLWLCPNIPWGTDPQDAALAQGLNWLVAASCAAGQDLSPVFVERWNLPVGRKTRQAFKTVDWKKKDLFPSGILASLPVEELPVSLRSVLSALMSPELITTNREAARRVLEIGGTVRVKIDGEVHEVKDAKLLPEVPFSVVAINFGWGNKKLRNETLALVKGLSGLKELGMSGDNRLSDGALVHLKELKELTVLGLDVPNITDMGVESLVALPALETLTMNGTKVTDQGMTELAKIKSLKTLWLSGTAVTDAGVKELAKLPRLEVLQIAGTKVTDQGVATLKAVLPKLRVDR